MNYTLLCSDVTLYLECEPGWKKVDVHTSVRGIPAWKKETRNFDTTHNWYFMQFVSQGAEPLFDSRNQDRHVLQTSKLASTVSSLCTFDSVY